MTVADWVKFPESVSRRATWLLSDSTFLSPSIQFSFPRLTVFSPAIGSNQLSLFINGNHSIQRGIPHQVCGQTSLYSEREREIEYKYIAHVLIILLLSKLSSDWFMKHQIVAFPPFLSIS